MASDRLAPSTHGFVIAVGRPSARRGLLGAANSYDLGSGAARRARARPDGVASLPSPAAAPPRAPRSGSPTARSASPTCDSLERRLLRALVDAQQPKQRRRRGGAAGADALPGGGGARRLPRARDGERHRPRPRRLGGAALPLERAGGGRQQVVGKRLVLDEARDDAAAVFAEVVALRNLPRHPHVVACVASFQAPACGALWLLLRHAGGGTLAR